MKKNNALIIFLFIQFNIASDILSINTSGQFWSTGYHNSRITDNSYNMELGYIPKISSSLMIGDNSMIDFEYAQYIFKNHNNYDGNQIISNKYRSWIRFSNNHLDLRIGLQKITFGTALFLRPLAWFDSLDFRFTTGQTDGVEALRLILSPSNSLAIWLWSIDNNISNKSYGGRIEIANEVGDWGFTYYKDFGSNASTQGDLLFSENNRLGIDYRYDGNFGFWIEGCYFDFIDIDDSIFLTLGFDYTLPISNGLLISTETMFSEIDLLNVIEKQTYTVFHLSFPIDHINHLTFFSLQDWKDRGPMSKVDNNSNNIRWSTTYDSFNIDYMFTLNPGKFNDVFQIMFIYNH